MSLYRKTVAGVVWALTQSFGQELLSFGVLVVLARMLSPADFGLFAMATVATKFTGLYQASGFSASIVQRETIDDDHLNTAFWVNVATSCVLAAALFCGAGLVAGFFKEPALVDMVRWMSVVLILGGLGQVQAQLLRRRMKFKALATRTLFAEPISGVLALLAAANGLGVWSLVVKQIAFRFVNLIVCWKVGGWRPGFSFSLRHARELISFGASMMGANGLNFVRSQGSSLIIGHLLGSAALGYYNMGGRIYNLTKTALIGGLGKVIWPMFSRLQGDMERLREAYYNVSRFSALVAFPAFTGILLIAPHFIPIAFGPRWGASIVVVQILAVQAIIESMSHYNETVLNALGRPHIRLAILTTAALVGFAGAYVAAHWGLQAVAVAYVLESAVMAVLGWIYVQRLAAVSVRAAWPFVRGAFVATVFMAACLMLLDRVLPSTIAAMPRLVVLVVTGVTAYVAALFFVDAKIAPDLRSLWELRHRRKIAG
jgi:PST family polysaccharide transporter